MRSSKISLALILTASLGCIAASSLNAAIINIMPSKDNTLYEFDPKEGDFSNALGFHFFAGNTAMSEIRRGVLAFDIAGSIPPGSTITAASLSLNMSRSPTNTAYVVELHNLLADWGEGTSIAPGEEGEGAPATANDATWRHRFFDNARRRFLGHGKCEPVGRRYRTLHVEFSTDGCGCAIVAGQPRQ